MFYNSLGNGNMIERNIMRITIVENMSDERIDYYVGKLVDALELEDRENIEYCIENLFYEVVSDNIINEASYMYASLNKYEKLEVKELIKDKCKNQPKEGFMWNCYYSIKIYYKLHKVA